MKSAGDNDIRCRQLRHYIVNGSCGLINETSVARTDCTLLQKSPQLVSRSLIMPHVSDEQSHGVFLIEQPAHKISELRDVIAVEGFVFLCGGMPAQICDQPHTNDSPTTGL